MEKRICLRLPAETSDKVEALALETGKKVSTVYRALINRGLKTVKEKKKPDQ